MTYDKVRVFANQVSLNDKTTKLSVYENKEKIVDKDLSANECLLLIQGMLPSITNTLQNGGRAEYWVPHHGLHP